MGDGRAAQGIFLLRASLVCLLTPWLSPIFTHTRGPGPFTTQEMAEWFQAGYFSMSLLVKRGCDEGFQPLGEVIKMWGRVPFAPGPSPPPLLVSTHFLCRIQGGPMGAGELVILGRPRRACPPCHSVRWACSCFDAGKYGPGALEEAAGAGCSSLIPAAAAPAVSSAGWQVWGPARAWRLGLAAGLSGPPPVPCLHSRQLPQCALREKAAMGDLTPPQQQQLTTFLQQLQALKPPRSGCLCVP